MDRKYLVSLGRTAIGKANDESAHRTLVSKRTSADYTTNVPYLQSCTWLRMVSSLARTTVGNQPEPEAEP